MSSNGPICFELFDWRQELISISKKKCWHANVKNVIDCVFDVTTSDKDHESDKRNETAFPRFPHIHKSSVKTTNPKQTDTICPRLIVNYMPYVCTLLIKCQNIRNDVTG